MRKETGKIEIWSEGFSITNILDADTKSEIKWFSKHYHRNNTRTFNRTKVNFQIEGIYLNAHIL